MPSFVRSSWRRHEARASSYARDLGSPVLPRPNRPTPTPAEVDDFVARHRQHSAFAIQHLASKLLADPRHGERWVWEWLDASRYADSNGYQGDNDRTAWPWRDWVIKAVDDNLPYDQFTVSADRGRPAAQRDQGAEAGHRLPAQPT